jgi:hypothetical protein
MLIESKSTLARLMATENIFVEQRKVPTASFDVKNRILTIPILNGNLSPEIYDLMIGHETGHALETPLEGWHNSVVDLKVNRTILNVCEDARIEKKIKRKFPGLRLSFTKGYRQLFDMDFFGVKGKNLNALNFIDRINLHTKGGASQGIEFTPEEQNLLNEVEDAESFDETVKVAIKIQKFMREELQKQKEEMQKAQPFKMPNDNDDDDYDYDYGDDDTDEEYEQYEASSEEGDEDLDEPFDKEGRGYDSFPNHSDDIRSETDEKFRQREQELYSKENLENLYADIPEIFLKEVIVPYDKLINLIKSQNTKHEYYKPEVLVSNYNMFRTESNKVVSYLVKEFEMRKNAEQQSRVRISKTGELNLNKIHEYRFTDDIFARMTKVPNGKSHGLVIFVDWSGSMNNNMQSTIKQLLNLVFFCKKVNIPFEVYGFSTMISFKMNDGKDGKVEPLDPIQKGVVGEISLPRFSLLNIFSSKMSARELTFMGSHLLSFPNGNSVRDCFVHFPKLMHLSGTPLNECIIAAFELLPQFKKQNKLEIVNTVFLTDGNGHCLNERYNTNNTVTTSLLPYKKRIWFRDPLTRASIEVEKDDTRYLSSSDYSAFQTIALLRMLKQRAECNIIGFYICDPRNVREAIENYTQKDNADKKVAEFRKNKFTVLSNIGYDDYYFIRSESMNIEDAEFEVPEKAKTTRALASAFSKYTSGRILNRVVLNRFVTLIA